MKLELLVSRYDRMIGLARYVTMLQKHLDLAGVAYTAVPISLPPALRLGAKVLRPLGYDLAAFVNTYPVSAAFTPGAVKHLTTQMMASLFTFQPGLDKTVITVHDIVPYLVRDDPCQVVYRGLHDRWMDDRAMRNIRRADRIIAISAYTGRMLEENLSCPVEKIKVILYGLDHELFHPVDVPPEFLARYQLDPADRHLLYVGSENPRKNLPLLIEALAAVKRRVPRVRLLKVGTPEYLPQFVLLKDQIRAAGLESEVRFIDHPFQEDLVRFLSFADAFVFPSLYEGFGMPPLEAMACGAPVICSNAASLPEVVGEAAITLDPHDLNGWVEAMVAVLEDAALRQDLRSRGLARAARFTWARAVAETLAVYQEVEAL